MNAREALFLYGGLALLAVLFAVTVRIAAADAPDSATIELPAN